MQFTFKIDKRQLYYLIIIILSFPQIVFGQTNDSAKISCNSNEFVSTSELESGLWCKIAVDTTGIFKIDYEDFSKNGFGDIQMDVKKIRLHGFGKGQLAERVGDNHLDDLPEIPIQVFDINKDNVFNENDYFIFYAESPHKWEYFDDIEQYHSNIHDYADTNYYFISINKKIGKRIEEKPEIISQPDYESHHHDFLMHFEENIYSLLNSGRYFLGKHFDLIKSYDFNINLFDHVKTENIYLFAKMAARSKDASSYTIKSNEFQGELGVPGIPSLDLNYQFADARISQKDFWFNNSQSLLNLTFTYNKSSNSSQGWMDYFDINYRRKIKLLNGQITFSDKRSKGYDVVKYHISGSTSGLSVWDVTNIHHPEMIKTHYENQQTTFIANGDTLRQFVAFDRTTFLKPTWIGKVENQNLHQISSTTNYIIFTSKALISEANRLADFHRLHSNLNVVVADIQKVYNEFSSGMEDISAIRNFLKMTYDKSEGENLKYALFFGDASFDLKNVLKKNNNIIPTYESKNIETLFHSYATDDFFAFLDEGEGDLTDEFRDMYDIATGRFPISDIEQAESLVNKIINYASKRDTVMSDWRNIVCFVADDEENNRFVNNAEGLSEIVQDLNPNINIEKIYFDAYPQKVYSGGQRYPKAKQALSSRIESGALFINYSGHGGETGLSDEKVVEIADINSWTNFDKLPIFVTATCEFSRFDDVERESAGELTLNNNKGGAIALFTTSRATGGADNYALNQSFYFHAFSYPSKKKRLGDIVMNTKKDYYDVHNTKHYILLGDPALEVALPNYNAKITSINDNPVSNDLWSDTLKALDRVKMTGRVYDYNNNFMSDYNGYAYISIYDKEEEIKTLAQDESSYETKFKLRKSLIFKGKSKVKGGVFNFSFIVPKDIDYQYGNGRVSLYVSNRIDDGNGVFENIIVGGYNNDATNDNQHPEIELFVNDTLFIDGGLTGDNPVLFAKFSDNTAINTVGTGIGHDIIAYIDDDKDVRILNDYYVADIGTYKSGTVTYPFYNIHEGKHTLYVKVWDVYNNSSSTSVNFEVVLKDKIKVRRLINYPNPVTSHTNFRFEHNYRNEKIDVSLGVYNMMGQEVYRQSKNLDTGKSFVFVPFEWDMKSNTGVNVNKGIYIYKVTVVTEQGLRTEETGKLLYIGN